MRVSLSRKYLMELAVADTKFSRSSSKFIGRKRPVRSTIPMRSKS